jgi:WD40 repeat protein
MNDDRPFSPIDFYFTGGTMGREAPSYIERRADTEIFEALRRGEFCYVLTSRQMGKSSLMIRTEARLKQVGVNVAALDLTAVGQNLAIEKWYVGLLVQIGQRLNLEDDLIDFWLSESMLGPMQRWIKAISEVVLPQCPGDLVIFIDEVDTVRSLPFSTDEFFAGIRECYNRRSEDPEVKRLSFCLLGVAAPSDLIRDTRTTPFNIGSRIELYDFTPSEAAPLAHGLGRGNRQGAALLKRILYWTGGHPYLTQRLCRAVAEDKNITGRGGVDRLCRDLFISRRAQARDNNLVSVRDQLLRGDGDVIDLLEIYARVLRHRRVDDDRSNPLVSKLRLSGITRAEDGTLWVRNRIYDRVFNRAWVSDNLPDAEKRRQRAAFLGGVWRTALVSSAILLLMGWLAFLALRERDRARKSAEMARRALYGYDLRLAYQEWQHGNIGRVKELLSTYLPSPDQPDPDDLRGFEWKLLNQMAHAEDFRLQEKLPVVAVAAMPDGKTVALGEPYRVRPSGADEYLIRLFDLTTQKPLSQFTVPAGRHFDLTVFSADRRQVAADGPDKEVRLFETRSGHEAAVFRGHPRAVTAIAISPDGRWLAAGDFGGTIIVWEIGTGREMRRFNHFTERIQSLNFSSDSGRLAAATGSQMVRIWDLATGRESPLKIENELLIRVWFFPGGDKLLAATSTGNFYFCDLRAKQIIGPMAGHGSEIRSAEFSPDRKLLATASADRSVMIWDAETGQKITVIRGHGSAVNSVTWLDGGKRLISGSHDGDVKIWEVDAIREPFAPRDPVIKYYASAFLPSRELIVMGVTGSGKVKLWNLSTGQEMSQINESGATILNATFLRDSKLLATGGLDRMVKIWDTATGKLVRTLAGHTENVYALESSPDGKLLVSGGQDRTLRVWDVDSGRELPSFAGGSDNHYRAVFSPDGKILASAGRNGEVKLWDVASRKIIRILSKHTAQVMSVAFSFDGRLLATGGRDNTLLIWSVLTGQELMSFGQTDFIQRAVFSCDGRRLVTGGADGSVKLWDLATQRELLTLEGHAAPVTSLTFSAGDLDLATTGADGVARLWRAAPKLLN